MDQTAPFPVWIFIPATYMHVGFALAPRPRMVSASWFLYRIIPFQANEVLFLHKSDGCCPSFFYRRSGCVQRKSAK